MALNISGETKAVATGLGEMSHDHLQPHIAIAPRLFAHFQIPLMLASIDSVLAIILYITQIDLAIKKEGFMV